MTVQFREKALMAYETMPSSQKNRVSKVIKQLDVDKSQRPYLMNHEDAFTERLDSLRGDPGAIEIEREGRRQC